MYTSSYTTGIFNRCQGVLKRLLGEWCKVAGELAFRSPTTNRRRLGNGIGYVEAGAVVLNGQRQTVRGAVDVNANGMCAGVSGAVGQSFLYDP